jgi:hypothetical protein|tara:strand:+ start:1871 stop:2329 length:459 start_codon:yes stop_codon:yes gene_type:complete
MKAIGELYKVRLIEQPATKGAYLAPRELEGARDVLLETCALGLVRAVVVARRRAALTHEAEECRRDECILRRGGEGVDWRCVDSRCIDWRCVDSRCVGWRCVDSRCVDSRCVDSRLMSPNWLMSVNWMLVIPQLLMLITSLISEHSLVVRRP